MAGNKPDLRDESGQPAAHHEIKDVNVWAVGKFAIALVLLCIVALVLLAGMVRYFMRGESAERPPSEGIDVDARKLPPEPRLQTAPVIDLRGMRGAEDQILNGYGWVDPQKGIVRIPIDRAMDLLVQRGLPSLPRNGAQTATTASVPTESGLGPKMLPPGGPLAPELGQGNK